MKLLAIESSGMTASVAIATESRLVGEYTINHKMTHSQTLMPMIDEVIRFTGMEPAELDAIAVSAGPGSFTGLRIGSATAKGMALALNIPIITVPTLDAMAYNLYNYHGIICPMTDARRDRVYFGIYCFKEGRLEVIHEQDVDEVKNVADLINQQHAGVILLGDGAQVYSDALAQFLDVNFTIAPMHMINQSAASVAALGMELYRNGMVQDGSLHRPIYLGLSQAEKEKAKARK